jgi:hypothetical protein
MAHFNSAFVTIFVLFVRASLADIPSLIERDDGLLDPLRYEVNQHGPVDFGALPLSGRSLIDSWMGKRATCTNSGYSPCTSTISISFKTYMLRSESRYIRLLPNWRYLLLSGLLQAFSILLRG